MTERLPDSGEENWADVLGSGDGTGGFLRVGHEDDGTLKPISATVGGVPDGWTVGQFGVFTIDPNAAGSTSATATQSLVVKTTSDGADALAVNYTGINAIPIHVTIPPGFPTNGLEVSSANAGVDSLQIGTVGGAAGHIRIPGVDTWLILGAADNDPTTSDLFQHEVAMWYDENVPSIKFLAKTGETGEIVLT